MDLTNGTTKKSSLTRDSKRPRSARLRKISDYRRQALADPDALVANLGAANSELMKMGYLLYRQICRAFARAADFDESAAALLVYLQLVRQSERLTQLEQRLRTPTVPAPSGGSLGSIAPSPLVPVVRVPPGASLDEILQS
jgi:hypothetical protein